MPLGGRERIRLDECGQKRLDGRERIRLDGREMMRRSQDRLRADLEQRGGQAAEGRRWKVLSLGSGELAGDGRVRRVE